MAPVWYYWPDAEARPGPANMAVDQALLELAGEEGLAALRVYRWEPHTLSFGRNEPATRRYDRAAIRREGIPTVRRPTGGRAVWHARELTYAVSAPTARFGALPAAYQAIHRTIAQGLGALGADARLAEEGGVAGLDAGACFASPVGGEVMVRGRKVVGSAQIRLGDGMLQHGSILLDDDQSRVAALTLGSPASGLEAPLNTVLPHPVGFGEVAAA
ncbi:MAG: biotin/lipoate A/B protein ligase family protein, partial [Bacillota bacterium]